eukprot:Sspe_Gene.113302::Locus_97354_Transcript_2_2_Confidence_0.400_Length_2682::g.113302::m.113302
MDEAVLAGENASCAVAEAHRAVREHFAALKDEMLQALEAAEHRLVAECQSIQQNARVATGQLESLERMLGEEESAKGRRKILRKVDELRLVHCVHEAEAKGLSRRVGRFRPNTDFATTALTKLVDEAAEAGDMSSLPFELLPDVQRARKDRGALLRTGPRDLRKRDLHDADLSYLDMAGVLLSKASLRGASLEGSDLSHAVVDATCLEGAVLRNTVLPPKVKGLASGGDGVGSGDTTPQSDPLPLPTFAMTKNDIESTDWSGADLSKTSVPWKLVRELLRRRRYDTVVLPPLDLLGKDVVNIDWSFTDLSHSRMGWAEVRAVCRQHRRGTVRLPGGIALHNKNISDIDWSFTDLSNVSVTWGALSRSLTATPVTGPVKLPPLDLTAASPSAIDSSFLDLSNVKLTWEQVQALLKRPRRGPVTLPPIDLRGKDLESVDWSYVDLRHVAVDFDALCVILRHAHAGNVCLPAIDLLSCDLSPLYLQNVDLTHVVVGWEQLKELLDCGACRECVLPPLSIDPDTPVHFQGCDLRHVRVDKNKWLAGMRAKTIQGVACYPRLDIRSEDVSGVVFGGDVSRVAMTPAQGEECLARGAFDYLASLPFIDLSAPIPSPCPNLLFCATCNGCEATVARIVDAKCTLDVPLPNGRTALFLAVKRCHPAVARLLLRGKASLEKTDDLGCTPLLYASRKGYLAMLAMLRSEGANISAVDRVGRTALFLAIESGHIEVVQYLLNAAHHLVNTRDTAGNTPLMAAAKVGSREMVLSLLDAGANARIRNGEGYTPLMFACERGDEVVARVLLPRSEVDATSSTGMTALSLACLHGHAGVVQLLLAQGGVSAARERCAYSLAVENGHLAVVSMLTEAGVAPPQRKKGMK